MFHGSFLFNNRLQSRSGLIASSVRPLPQCLQPSNLLTPLFFSLILYRHSLALPLYSVAQGNGRWFLEPRVLVGMDQKFLRWRSLMRASLACVVANGQGTFSLNES